MSDKTILDVEPMAPLIDRRYRVVSRLGEGGFGSVYLVEDIWFGRRRVALKLLHKQHQQDEAFERRFRDEIDVLRSLRHPGITEIINDGRTAAGELYFTMEYVAGVVLDALLKSEAPLPPERVLRFVHQLFDVLSAAEALGVVHRDLKPKNIIVQEPGSADERLKVLDFGIAKILRPNVASSPGSQPTQGIVGTEDYMAPEQFLGQDLDTRTDLYAMGLIVHQMLAGEYPFEGETSEARRTNRLRGHPRPLPAPVPAPLRNLVRALLEVDRDKRPLLSEARRLVTTRRRVRRRATLAGVAVLGVAGLAAWMGLSRWDSPDPPQAPSETASALSEPGPGEPDPNAKPDENPVVPLDEAPDDRPSDSQPPRDPIPERPPEVDPSQNLIVEGPRDGDPSRVPAPVRMTTKEYRFSTYPSLAEVYVDGEERNSNENGYFVRSLVEGEHRFLVRDEDGVEYTLTYVVESTDLVGNLVIDYWNKVVRPPGQVPGGSPGTTGN